MEETDLYYAQRSDSIFWELKKLLIRFVQLGYTENYFHILAADFVCMPCNCKTAQSVLTLKYKHTW